MSDYSELKKLAEAAPEGPWFGPEYAPGTSYVFDVDLGTLLAYESIDSEKDACLRYVAAANPAALLALIAENEHLAKTADCWDRLNIQNKALSDSFQAERDQLKAEVAGLKTGYEAYERVNAELKAENEALRKDAERYRFLRDDKSQGKADFCIVLKHWTMPELDRILEIEEADEQIEAAMSKEESL